MIQRNSLSVYDNIYIYIYIYIYKSRLKSSLADQDTLKEYDHQMKFTFQRNPSGDSHTSSIGAAALESHWYKKLSTADMMSLCELFSLLSDIYIYY